jgi:hypothetical protein
MKPTIHLLEPESAFKDQDFSHGLKMRHLTTPGIQKTPFSSQVFTPQNKKEIHGFFINRWPNYEIISLSYDIVHIDTISEILFVRFQ